MKIFDSFMYFNEDLILDIRLNELDRFVDKFVIVESTYTHSGEKKKLNFDINKYRDFSKKIIYITSNDFPTDYQKIDTKDTQEERTSKKLLNGIRMDNYQRNKINEGLISASDDDLILLSDIDEIPNLHSVNLDDISSQILVFNQFFFHYKFNLFLKGLNFFGTKGCLKKYFKSPQWLRNIKNKKYSFFRLDTFFSNKKYRNLKFVQNGGWHFSNIMDANQIIYKLKSYAHHAEFPESKLSIETFNKLIQDRKIMYDHAADSKKNKYNKEIYLDIFDHDLLPAYIKKKEEKFSKWLI
tara:strand:+ start:1717 stop:2607 length:891 start_codon:yes stop_codon:yes gene_type:complete